MKNILYLLPIAIICLSASCENSQGSQNDNYEDTVQTASGVWLEMEPVQCLNNPWEKGWLSSGERKYEDYPIGKVREVEQEERDIINSYYQHLGVDILEIDSEPFPEDVMVCEACSCPVGYTLYARVKDEDAQRLKDLGWKMSEKN